MIVDVRQLPPEICVNTRVDLWVQKEAKSNKLILRGNFQFREDTPTFKPRAEAASFELRGQGMDRTRNQLNEYAIPTNLPTKGTAGGDGSTFFNCTPAVTCRQILPAAWRGMLRRPHESRPTAGAGYSNGPQVQSP